VGIATTEANWDLAVNASILLVTNVVSIILGAALVFRVIGVGKTLGDEESPGWARFSLMFLSLFWVLLVAPLLLALLEESRAGARRSLVYAVSPQVTDAVRDHLEGVPGAELIVVSRNSPEPGAAITVLVASDTPQPQSFEDAVTETVSQARGGDVPVRVFTLLSASRSPASALAPEGDPAAGDPADPAAFP